MPSKHTLTQTADIILLKHTKKQIPSEMEVSLRYKLLTLLPITTVSDEGDERDHGDQGNKGD